MIPQDLPLSVLERRPRRRFKQKESSPRTSRNKVLRNVFASSSSSTSLTTTTTTTSTTTSSSSTSTTSPTTTTTIAKTNDPSILIAIAIWYILGIVSISTTKILLVHGIPPLVLTVQQLLIGSTILKFFITWQNNNAATTTTTNLSVATEDHPKKEIKNEYAKVPLEDLENGGSTTPTPISTTTSTTAITTVHNSDRSLSQLWKEAPYLVISGICFTLGFLATNFGFETSSPSFVETIKAAEPLTSAGLAVGYGLESLSFVEWSSLATLILGVLASTLGNASMPMTSTMTSRTSNTIIPTSSSLWDSLLSCTIVMVSNLCFSLRGLYQKWYLQLEGSTKPKAEELQVQMQQLGVWVLIGPTVLGYGKWGILHLLHEGISLQYVGLAIVNGLAFTIYNLSSTWLLNRISMVHHAALNCIRRIFAIVATSIIFRIPMTSLGVLGVLISMGGFLSFTHAKATKSKRKRKKSIVPQGSTTTTTTTTTNSSSPPGQRPQPEGVVGTRRNLQAPKSGSSIHNVGRFIIPAGTSTKER